MIALKGNHSLNTVEQHLAKLSSAQPDETLLLPTKLRARRYLGASAVLQLITSWRERCPDGELRVHVQAGDDDPQIEAVLSAFVRTDHGLMAIALARRVTDVSGSRDLTTLARTHLEGRLQAMTNVPGISRGPKVFAMCLDRSRYAAPAVLYTRPAVPGSAVAQQDPELLDDSSWKDLATQIDDRLWNTTEEGRASVHDSGALAGILRELMRNTHNWARKDATETPYGSHRSVRGFRIESHTADAARDEAALDLDGPLAHYFGHPRLAPRRGQRRFVELTIFDSGPGLAARFLRDRLGDRVPTLEQEEAELRRCIRKHMTSSLEWHRGQGLAEVINLADKAHGFIWIRSGRLSLYRDFVASPCGDDAHDAERLSQWRPDAPPAPVAGTSIVAILPVGDV